VAYYVARDGEALSARTLSDYLNAKLPSWMMPSMYLPVAAFPLTPNGKVDYAALPVPSTGSVGFVERAMGTDWEQKVAAVWRNVLEADHVGLDDNFFDIGGTSLLLVKVHSKLQALSNRKLPIADLFASTTVRTLAGRLGGSDQEPGLRNSIQDQAQKQRAAFARARAAKKAIE
jgi:hypothetical protein